MKKLILAVTLVVLLAAAVFGGQAIASNKPADVSVSEEASQEILFDWGGSYWGSPVRMQSFQGYFDASDSPNAYSGYILEESYPEVRHVSVTIGASSFDSGGDDRAYIAVPKWESSTVSIIVNNSEEWANQHNYFGTIEFNADSWFISLDTYEGSSAKYEYAVTVTYPR